MNEKKAIIKNGCIIYGESAEIVGVSSTEARSRREAMKVKHRKTLLQKNQVDYYKAYPGQANDLPDETRRLLS